MVKVFDTMLTLVFPIAGAIASWAVSSIPIMMIFMMSISSGHVRSDLWGWIPSYGFYVVAIIALVLQIKAFLSILGSEKDKKHTFLFLISPIWLSVGLALVLYFVAMLWRFD